jgi:glyoxylase-like metal-dependent hydrolase (beta-lactamase superfamily II)
MMQIETLTVGPFQSNCYIVGCEQTGDAIIIDCGDEAPRILAEVERLGVNVKAVVNTHTHLDHVAALADVVDVLGVPVLMHAADMPVYDMLEAQAAMFGLSAPRRVKVDRFVEHGEKIEVGKLGAEVLLAPGHSPGSICLAFDKGEHRVVFAGDVLFRGSIGRTDLPGGSYETIVETLRTLFVPMPDDTVVYPGHGPETTMGEEKRTNPFVAPLTGG